MTGVDIELRRKIEAFGTELTPALLEGTRGLFTELHEAVEPGPATVHSDEQYGPDERHRLDVFEPQDQPGGRGRAVLLFVHGGGFVMGDKATPGSPFFGNIGQWAARCGWVGAAMTYRLAPAHTWPSGAEDVGLAVQWLTENVRRFGGDPGKIFVMGTSAGAVHVAGYIVSSRFHGAAGRALAGGMLISGIYDLPSAERNEFQQAYFGVDDTLYAERSTLAGLMETDLPLLASVSEFDGIGFQRQAALYVATAAKTQNRYPRMLYLIGQNHLSSTLQIGLPTDTLGPQVLQFVTGVVGPK